VEHFERAGDYAANASAGAGAHVTRQKPTGTKEPGTTPKEIVEKTKMFD
jgi:hypothetical protein